MASGIINSGNSSTQNLVRTFEEVLTNLSSTNPTIFLKANFSEVTNETGLAWETKPIWCPTLSSTVSAGNILFWMLCMAINAAAQSTGRVLGFDYEHRALLRASPVFYFADGLGAAVEWLVLLLFRYGEPRLSATRVLANRLDLIAPTSEPRRDIAPLESLKKHTRLRMVAFLLGVLPQHFKLFFSHGVTLPWWQGCGLLFSWVVFELIILAAKSDIRCRVFREEPSPFPQFEDWEVMKLWSRLALLVAIVYTATPFVRSLAAFDKILYLTNTTTEGVPGEWYFYSCILLGYIFALVIGMVLWPVVLVEFAIPSSGPALYNRIRAGAGRYPRSVSFWAYYLIFVSLNTLLIIPFLTSYDLNVVFSPLTDDVQFWMTVVLGAGILLLTYIYSIVAVIVKGRGTLHFVRGIATFAPLIYYVSTYDESSTYMPKWLAIFG